MKKIKLTIKLPPYPHKKEMTVKPANQPEPETQRESSIPFDLQENIAVKPTIRSQLAAFRQDIRSFLEANRKTFLFLLILHIIGISALVRANVPYIDDVRRVYNHTRNFGFGRELSNFLAIFIHTDKSVRDITPLTQLLAVCFLSAAGCIVIHLLLKKRKFDPWAAIAVLPLGLSPYFLECLSYKFDSPYMALSILVSVIPFLFLKYGLPLYGIVSVAGCLSMCLLYQASSGIYPMLTILLCFRQWNNGRPLKDILRFSVVSAFCYIVGLIIFRIRFAVDSYSSIDSSISINMLPKNLRQYFTLIQSDFKSWWLTLIAVIVLFFVYAATRDTVRRPRILSGLLAAVTVLVMLFLSFGAYIFFKKPLSEPRAMYGFGVFLALISVCAAGAKRIYPAKLACFCLSWVFFVFAFIYGNALADNQRYLEYRTGAAITDICETDVFLSAVQSGQKILIQTKGTIGRSPLVGDSNLLKRLVPTIISGNWSHGRHYFQWYYGIGNQIKFDSSKDYRKLDLPILKDSFYHTIRGDSEHILVEFKR